MSIPNLYWFVSVDEGCDKGGIEIDENVVGVCKLSDIQACGSNQMCVQTHDATSNVGVCVCLNGYNWQETDVSCK